MVIASTPLCLLPCHDLSLPTEDASGILPGDNWFLRPLSNVTELGGACLVPRQCRVTSFFCTQTGRRPRTRFLHVFLSRAHFCSLSARGFVCNGSFVGTRRKKQKRGRKERKQGRAGEREGARKEGRKGEEKMARGKKTRGTKKSEWR